MKISQSAKDKIKEFEGCRLDAYRCPAGVLTIGYGHTGPDVKEGMKITRAEADALFDRDIDRFETSLRLRVGALQLTPWQWDALVSFAYNVGVGALERSTLYRKVCTNPLNPAIRDEFLRWNKAGGKVLPGLVKRRIWESQRYFSEA